MSFQSIIETRYSAIDVDTYSWSLTELCDLYRQDKLIFPEGKPYCYLDVELASLLESLIVGVSSMSLFAYLEQNVWELFDIKGSRKLKQLIEFNLSLKPIIVTTRGFEHWRNVSYKDIPPKQQRRLQLSKFPVTLITGDRELATSYITSRI